MLTTDNFTWDSEHRTFSAEISDLTGTSPPLFLGNNISIQSRRTGAVATFVLSGERRDVEGDLLCLELVPTPETLRDCPELLHSKVVLFND